MKYLFLILMLLILGACTAQNQQQGDISYRLVGGPCEICDWIEDYRGAELTPIDTFPDFNTKPQKLKITGTIYEADGKTPARNTILFIYHTDETGEYQWRNDKNGKRYVHHRGWIKTGNDGRYTFFTFRPGAYPGGGEPEHIHPIIKEPNGKVYYIDEILFNDDPLLTPKKRTACSNRGGSGIVDLIQTDTLLLAQRDIILGLNIPQYD